MTDPAPILRYLRACHEADNREASLLDLFHRSVKHLYFTEGTEVVTTGLQDGVAVPPDLGVAAMKEALTHRREMSLVYAALPVVGIRRDAAGRRRTCAPLLTYPAALERRRVAGEEVTVLRVRTEEQAVNVPLLAQLVGEGDGTSNAVEALLEKFPGPPLSKTSLADALGLLASVAPGLELDGLARFPELSSEREVRRRLRELSSEEAPRLACLSAAAMALVPNPPASRGVLFELGRMAAARRGSTALRAVLAPSKEPPAVAEMRDVEAHSVPAVLSLAQQRALASTRSHPLTLIVGPPGTGKSFTVSAVALDHVLRGESVLIACRTEQALQVIAAKLAILLGESTPILRGGSPESRRESKRFLERLLAGGFPAGGEGDLPLLRRRLRALDERVRRLEKRLEERERLELLWGELACAESPRGWLDALRLRWRELRLQRAQPLPGLSAELEEALEARIATAAELLQASRRARITKLLDRHRAQLQRFSSAIRARSSGRQEKLFAETDLSVLLQAFPLWMCTFRELHRLVPLEPELFDLVVIDEATQSDLASPLPALFRAKRAAVTGDPRQLRHVSFLSRARQGALGELSGLAPEEVQTLDYRAKSLLDLVDERLASQSQVAFLDEHYRSMPAIIAFSNREFYNGGIRVMTARPETIEHRAVEVRRVSGRRSPEGVNELEAQALVGELTRVVEVERDLEPGTAHTIGVLSPFRPQVEHLSERIRSVLSITAIDKHALLVGTAYGFQGEERDLMLLSFCVDDESHPSALRYLGRPDVFNVSVTRARDHQVVFLSANPREGLLARYVAGVEEGSPASRRTSPERDRFLEDVSARLRECGFRLYPAFAVGGTSVDLLVETGGRSFGIDLVGHPGAYAPAIARERHRMLARAGLPLFPLSLYAWRRDETASLEAIRRFASTQRGRRTFSRVIRGARR